MKGKNMSDLSKDKIDITMTAVLRPSILSGTLNTIRKNVCRGDEDRYRLIINIDPIGEKIDPLKVVSVAQKNFKNVLYNIAESPSFPIAVKWAWSQVEAPYVFHWEDDVDILHEIDVDKMIDILKKYPHLSSLRLYKAITPNQRQFNTFSCKWVYNADGFYLAKDWRRQFGLNPILIKSEFVKDAVTRMRIDVNPEKQFRESQKYMRPLIKKWNYGLYTNPGAPRMVDGRKGQRWKNKQGIDKPKGITFTEWVKKGK
jgi:hypothetical protein